MTMQTIKSNGEYLGFCEQKGSIYSIFRGYEKDGSKQYAIASVKDGEISFLIDYTGTL